MRRTKTLRRMFALAFAIRVCTASGFNRSAFVFRFPSPLLSPELVLGKLVEVANAVSFCVPTAFILPADSFSAKALHDREFKLADQCSHLCLIFEERPRHGYAYVR